MTDFAERFAALFKRLQHHWYEDQVRIEVAQITGFPPFDKNGDFRTSPLPGQHSSWLTTTSTAVICFYTDKYPKDERSLSGKFPRECACILVGLGLGVLLDNGDEFRDRFTIYAREEAVIYKRLPPLGPLNSDQKSDVKDSY